MRRLATVSLILLLLLISILNTTAQEFQNQSMPSGLSIYDDNNFKSRNDNEYMVFQNLDKLDEFFIENEGQIENDLIRFYTNDRSVWFTDKSIYFELNEKSRQKFTGQENSYGYNNDRIEPDQTVYKRFILELSFPNSNPIKPQGHDEMGHYSNFFYGNESLKWYSGVYNYREIIYRNLYDNIDLKYYLTAEGLKYDFVVHPGGDPNEIKLHYTGQNQLKIDDNGNIRISTVLGEIFDSKPIFFQNDNYGANKFIEGEFKIFDSMTYGFKIVDDYMTDIDLIIDPLLYSTYVGGIVFESGNSIAIDSSGHAYITGSTTSSTFPVKSGSYDTSYNGGISDVIVFKLNNSGDKLLYSTFIGGTSEGEYGDEIVVDSNGNAYVTGYSKSANFPTTSSVYDNSHNGGMDVFILKLNPTGSALVYSTFVGGSTDDIGQGIAIDDYGCAYVTGNTDSTNFPTSAKANDSSYNGNGDVFALKLNSTGKSLIYSTYIGGSEEEKGYDVAVDSNGFAYITGYTLSSSFPTTAGSYDTTFNAGKDIFVSKLNQSGDKFIYSTFIGGTNNDDANSIKIDPNGNAYVTGFTESTNLPTTSNAFDTSHNSNEDVFVLKLNAIGQSLFYCTYVGGTGVDVGRDIAIDSENNVYVTGWTYSTDFPTTSNAYNGSYGGSGDIFVFKLSRICEKLLYSTYIGGTGDEPGRGIAVGENNTVYVTGDTASTDFPTTPNAYDTTKNNGDDIVVVKLNFTDPLFPPIIIDLKISEPIVNRTDSVLLYAKVKDYVYSENTLTPGFEYLEPGEIIWNNTYFSNLTVITNQWEAVFTPPKNAILGLYDFKVRFNNSAQLYSSWKYLNSSLIVKNNIPRIELLSLSENKTLRGKDISISVKGDDVEDESKKLSLELEYRDPNENSWNTTFVTGPVFSNDFWKYTFNLSVLEKIGLYDLRARINDTDGDFSGWFYRNDSLEIVNSIPEIIDVELSSDVIFRTESISFFVNATDYETEEQNLDFHLEYKYSIETVWISVTGIFSGGENRWNGVISTNLNSKLGFYDYRIRFRDVDGDYCKWHYRNNSFQIVNKIPEIIDVNLSDEYVLRTDSIKIFIDVIDFETPEAALIMRAEYKHSNDNNWINVYGKYSPFNSRWEIQVNTTISTKLGAYDIRINFTDSDGAICQKYFSDAYAVLNNRPSVDDFIISKDEGLLGDRIRIWINGSDIEDPEVNLSLELEYRDPNNIEWNTTYLSDPVYDTDKWVSILSIPDDAVFGYYDIRFRFHDSDNDLCEWEIVNDSFLLYNIKPEVIDVQISDEELFRTESAFIYVNGTDYETDESQLTLIGQYKSSTEPDWLNITGYYSETWSRWEVEFVTYINSPVGVYDFRMKFIDTHGASSEWLNKMNFLEVKNNLPEISGDLKGFNIDFRTTTFDLTGYESDIEDTDENLTWEIDQASIDSDLCSMSIIDINNDILQIKPGTNVSGAEIITLLLRDSDGGVAKRSNITINVNSKIIFYFNVNLTVSPKLINVTRGDSKILTLTISNLGELQDNYTLTFLSAVFNEGDIVIADQTLAMESGGSNKVYVTFTAPKSVEPGIYSVKFNIKSDYTSDVAAVKIKIMEDEEKGNVLKRAGTILAIIIIIIVTIVILFFILKRKRKPGIDAGEGAIQEQSQIQPEIPEQPVQEVGGPAQPSETAESQITYDNTAMSPTQEEELLTRDQTGPLNHEISDYQEPETGQVIDGNEVTGDMSMGNQESGETINDKETASYTKPVKKNIE